MKKYSKKLIWDYIKGEEIDNIDELENDYKFIMEVIKYTKDKKLYNICSDQIKLNYEFVLFLINLFKNDKKFILNVAKYYLDNNKKDDITNKELIFIMSNILNTKEKTEESIHYNLLKKTFIIKERVLVKKSINKSKDKLTKINLGLGFIVLQCNEYKDSQIIMDEFAKDMIKEIFHYNEHQNLEEKIHNDFNTLENLRKIELKQYLINYIKKYDVYLANYVFTRTYLLEDVLVNIKELEKNWNNYEINKKLEQDELFEEKAKELIKKYNVDFDFFDACIYIDKKKLKLPKLCYSKIDIDIINLIDENNILHNKCIKEIITLANNIYNKKNIKLEEKIENKNTKILKFERK